MERFLKTALYNAKNHEKAFQFETYNWVGMGWETNKDENTGKKDGRCAIFSRLQGLQ